MKRPDFIPLPKWKIMRRRARLWFEKPEDRQDFLQECAVHALELWKDKLGTAELVTIAARRTFLKMQYCKSDSRGGERCMGADEQEMLEKAHHEPLADLLDYCVPVNPKDRGEMKWTLVTENGIKIRMSYDEIAEATKMKRESCIHSKMNLNKINVFVFNKKIHKGFREVQATYGLTEWKARSKTKKYQLEWAYSNYA